MKMFANARWPLIVVLGLVACANSGCNESTAGGAGPKKQIVRVARPLQREVTEYVYFTGRTDAVEAVDIQARVTGYLEPVEFQPGSEIQAGQQLFKIDPRPYQAALDEAVSQVKLAEARLQLAIADYQRAQEVARTPGAISKQDLDKYAAAQSEASASVQAAQANSEAAKLNLEFTSITSPIAGRVGRNLLTEGNLVKQDTTLLTTVVSQDPMYAYFDVDEHTMLRVQKLIREGKVRSVRDGAEMPVELGLANEGDAYPHRGKIDFVNNRVDPSTGTLQVRASFPNPLIGMPGSRLLSPGLFVRVRMPLGSPFQALLVPEAAINTDQGLKYLLVVNSSGVVEYRPVQLGPQQPGGLQVMLPMKMIRTKEGMQLADENTPADVETVDSLTADDQVVISGLQMVRPGMVVETRLVDITPGPKGIMQSEPVVAPEKVPDQEAEPDHRPTENQNQELGAAAEKELPDPPAGEPPAEETSREPQP